ncbi:MAG TPA: adenylyl-sulfate reductase subunit alpha, partial [Desulfobacteria bacterium]|nr:adenylyl-sulfate reductase subunit alpha [Desulfobacteria bacterium]
VEYVNKEFEQVIRRDLVYSIGRRLNKVTQKIEQLGLPILKDEQGNYVARGRHSIKINGENIKPILAEAVNSYPKVTVLNHVNICDYLLEEGQVIGAWGFSVDQETLYVIYAKAVICATGGAAGLYKPNNPGFSRHKMWYPPFNTGAGYAMGIRAGAEMTGFELRFIALRCKDTIAPTGTIAQGVGAKQVNSRNERYLAKYGKPTTAVRLYATVKENQQGNGPCYLETKGIDTAAEEELYKAYLNMAPAQTLRWMEQGKGPRDQNVEIEGTEPYIVGGHSASGYWVDTARFTTLPGLLAAGDVAGGSPKKYVTGCFAEGEIAAHSALKFIADKKVVKLTPEKMESLLARVNDLFQPGTNVYELESIEEAMQRVMDEYAGGISTGYSFNAAKLAIAQERIEQLCQIAKELRVGNNYELLQRQELIDRLEVCRVLICHLLARHETRWPCYQANADFPQKDDQNWLKYVNSIKEKGEIKIVLRELVRDYCYEH